MAFRVYYAVIFFFECEDIIDADVGGSNVYLPYNWNSRLPDPLTALLYFEGAIVIIPEVALILDGP